MEQMEEKNVAFEEALGKVEAIVREMENGQLPLEQSVARFEEGMQWIAYCQKKLDGYEQSIAKVLEDGSVKPLEER